ncbi:acyl-CoA synthetase (AMP-forming)/AMP-acid ligase II/acyl-CoA reductase-like NAD-dependent aldehyde dehydrogenase [Crossiella equi]|uniref:Acyl-CoA synthetase (AMP-forming)/AMP-acid ligase II/acyl-CoA reductase-like NAD-dependent aldehyde dehydrogenase n=1 Tax=Crossiella equi TaxID=130796 RepID=A0ABS5AAP9_9PSEU|nr:acyl-CoA synthetase (AMP-forming)/AMP-acid ligase II/acyl-CoA reductase-like NAD-dependent aldehyde dehydrogenase [Crossiella equi]
MASIALGAAEALTEAGVAKGDRVVVQAENSAEFATTVMALVHLDVSIVLLHPGLSAERSRKLSDLVKARWVIASADVATGENDMVKRVAIETLTARQVTGKLSSTAWGQRADALICFTAGAENEPRGVVRTGRSLLRNARSLQKRLEITDADVLLPLLPFSHADGFAALLMWQLAGCGLTVAPRTGPVEAMLAPAATVVDARPATYRELVRLAKIRPEAVAAMRANVRAWLSTGEPAESSLVDSFAATFDAPLLGGYRTTEVGTIAQATLERPGGCGTELPGFGVEVHDAYGEPVAQGQIGELVVRLAEPAAKVLNPDGTLGGPTRRLHATNDLGFRDADGVLHVIGRREPVATRGRILHPDLLARVAEATGHPVRMVPVKDASRAHQMVALVLDADGERPSEWRARISSHLPAYAQPAKAVVLPQFPIDAIGKVDMIRLRDLAQREMNKPAQQPSSGPAPVAFAADRRVAAQSRLPYPERRRALHEVVRLLTERTPVVMSLMTEFTGYRTALQEIHSTVALLTGATDEVQRNQPTPVGKLAVALPANGFLHAYAQSVLVPALYSGEIVVSLPAGLGETGRRLHQLLATAHRLPVRLADGGLPAFAAAHALGAEAVVLHGEPGVAEQLRAQLSPDQLMVFHGTGLNPFIVAQHADLIAAADDAVRARLLDSGQHRMAPQVFAVHADCVSVFMELLVQRLGRLRFGDHTNPQAGYGPVRSVAAIEAAAARVSAHRDQVVLGGLIDKETMRVDPLVTLRSLEQVLAGVGAPVEPIAAPVFDVISYRDPAELREWLGSTQVSSHAAGASVYGKDVETVRQLSADHTVCTGMALTDADYGNRAFGGRGHKAGFRAFDGIRVAEPLLLSKAAAEALGRGRTARLGVA